MRTWSIAMWELGDLGSPRPTPYFENKEETKSKRPKGPYLVPCGLGGSAGSS